MKKHLSWILFTICILVGVLLAGCGSGKTGNQNSETANTTETTKEDSEITESENTEQTDSKVATTSATEDTEESEKTLVVYYSATGTTKGIAEKIAEEINGELFELKPVEEYTDDDLNGSNDDSRVSREHADESLRDVELTEVTPEDFNDVSVVILGYPIWWEEAAWPVNNFVKNNDFTGKTVIPFCTSASSGIGDSGKLLEEMAGTGNWQEGKRFASNANDKEIQEWADSLNLK